MNFQTLVDSFGAFVTLSASITSKTHYETLIEASMCIADTFLFWVITKLLIIHHVEWAVLHHSVERAEHFPYNVAQSWLFPAVNFFPHQCATCNFFMENIKIIFGITHVLELDSTLFFVITNEQNHQGPNVLVNKWLQCYVWKCSFQCACTQAIVIRWSTYPRFILLLHLCRIDIMSFSIPFP